MDYKTTISDIFSPRKNKFAVPGYQRAFSWEVGREKDKEIPQFFQDLVEHPASMAQYHYGHFLFEQDKQDRNKYWIIDGQQRITTAVIFLSCIYDRLSTYPEYEREANNLFNEYLKNTDSQQKFQTVEYDNNFFLNIVIEKREDKIDTKSRRRIKEALSYFKDKIDAAAIEDVLHWKNLIEDAKITTDTVEDKAEAAQLFVFQNDRGKDLTNLEKLKAFLMLQIFLSVKNTEIDPNLEISFVEKEFESIYKALEKIEIANEDQVLNYHGTAFLSLSGSAFDKVNNAIRKLSSLEQMDWIKDFSVNLKRSYEYIITIQEKRNTNSYIPDILYLDSANSFPLLLKLFHNHIENPDFENILHLIEITLFKLQYSIGKYHANYLPNIALNFNGDTSDLKNKLLYHANRGFKEYWNFDGNFMKLLEGDYHYFSLTRYLLWKYENFLRDKVKEPLMSFPEFSNLYGSNRLESTIDHWTPQNPYEIEYEQEFKEKYLNNIGNLVLSTRGRNASDGNNLPKERSTMSTLISRQKLEEFKGQWGKTEIKNRQNEIVEFAKDCWNPDIIK